MSALYDESALPVWLARVKKLNEPTRVTRERASWDTPPPRFLGSLVEESVRTLCC